MHFYNKYNANVIFNKWHIKEYLTFQIYQCDFACNLTAICIITSLVSYMLPTSYLTYPCNNLVMDSSAPFRSFILKFNT